MKFRLILTFAILVEFASIRGYLLEEPASEYSEREFKRQKRTLTTICVEIKPSNPYEEPYFMCKGTDTPQSSKGGSYSDSGSQSSKPSYKPTSYGESDYQTPVKTNYQPEYTKYGTQASYEPAYGKKTSYSSPDDHSSYSTYEHSKTLYGVNQYDSHDSVNDYFKSNAHQPVHSSSSKPENYNPSAYSDPAGYSKPGSYGPSIVYNNKPAHGYSSYSKAPSISSGAHSFSYDGKYPSTSSYSSKPASNEHIDLPGYKPPKVLYSSQSASKPYSKPGYNPSSAYNKLDHQGDHTKHSTLDYIQPLAKPQYSSNPYGYRGMTEDMMMPMWGSQQPDGNSQLHSTDNSMEYFGMDAPRSMEQYQQPQYQPDLTNMDYTNFEQSEPKLQAPAPLPTVGYGPYSQPIYSVPRTLSYQPAVITPTTYSPYVPVPCPSAPISYASPLHLQAYHPAAIPSCSQSYLYSLQPTIVSLPCFSSDPSVGSPHQFYQTNINPLHDAPGGRSAVSETDKFTDTNSTSPETEETTKSKLGPEKESNSTKQEGSKTVDTTSDKSTEKKADQAVAKESSKEDQPSPMAVTKEPEDGSTKVAYEAMVKMARLAAQLKKDPDDE